MQPTRSLPVFPVYKTMVYKSGGLIDGKNRYDIRFKRYGTNSDFHVLVTLTFTFDLYSTIQILHPVIYILYSLQRSAQFKFTGVEDIH